MLKSEHYEIRSDEAAYFENLENLIDIKDAPLSIPNEVPHYELCCNLKKKATVVLTGGGADEIFYGYGRIFRSTYDYERLKRLDLITKNGSKALFLKNFKAKYGKVDFENELEHFMNCLKGDETPSLGLIDGKRVLELALAIKNSMRTGKSRRLAA